MLYRVYGLSWAQIEAMPYGELQAVLDDIRELAKAASAAKRK